MKKLIARKRYWVAGGTLAALLLGVLFRHEIASGLMTAYRFLADRDRIEQLVTAFGDGAPLAFMGIQILQVIIAPVPGEATGFIGGYLFGSFKGFLYSTVALSLGSWINFGIGRFLGKRYVRGWIPDPTLKRFDHLAKRQGVIVMFILFVFPGFPKDYLCLFLGITAIPLKVFLIIASVGRIPGTLLLSLQGDFLFKKNYVVFAVVFAVTALVAFLTIRFRDAIYRWLEKLNGKSGTDR
ncbi:TVP38/TMEM64 family protein [Desulfosarcina widdelii]|uniref:TVP38/TMEM64 family membrane protein n=1 Tax=Desulfosarcina widdelii TaxID=947919 RepID=A0A5K7YXM0_9BACT|nr:VTT domain-containing protein [Desulfosarcina widdelii]BBO74522.1 TVP38/TMEM64 family protein [Desulfosarcina widdelii]